MARKGKKLSVRVIKRGDIVRSAEGTEEVVRDVQIILQLSNGNNEVHTGVDRVEVLPPEELPELEEGG